MKRNKKNSSVITPIGLAKKMKSYGLKFPSKKYFTYILLGCLFSLGIGLLLHLKPIYIMAISISIVIMIPSYLFSYYKELNEQERFTDASRYIENILYSFSDSKKIKVALENTEKIYPKGNNMKECIEDALDYIYKGKFKKNLYQEALSFIEDEYDNQRIRNVNNFMINVERNGGDIDLPKKLLLEDKQNWYDNVCLMQDSKKKKFKEVVLSVIAATSLCVIFLYLELNLPSKMNITNNIVTQISATALIIGMLFIIKKAKNKLAFNWLDREKRASDKQIIDNYNYLLHFNNKKEKLESILWASPFLIACITLFILHNKNMCIVCGIIGLLLLFQHKLNYILAYKSALKELKVAFPNWLLNLILLLQTNNVQVSIQKSRIEAPAILKNEIDLLLERINKYPTKIESYTSFFSLFSQNEDFIELQQTMQTLYTLSQIGSGNVEAQLNNLINSIYKMRRNSDKILNENILLGMSIIFKAPYLLASAKLILDLGMFICIALPAMAR